jgi:hypothetical protein
MKKSYIFLSGIILGGLIISVLHFIPFIQASPDAPNPGHAVSQIEPGTDGQVLTTSGTSVTWAEPSGGDVPSGVYMGWGQLITCTGSDPGDGSPVYPVTCSGNAQAGSYCTYPWWNRTCSCAEGTMVITGCQANYDSSRNQTFNNCYVTCRMP